MNTKHTAQLTNPLGAAPAVDYDAQQRQHPDFEPRPRRLARREKTTYDAERKAALEKVFALTQRYVALCQFKAGANIESAVLLAALQAAAWGEIEDARVAAGLWTC